MSIAGPLGAAFEDKDSILESFEAMLEMAKFSPSKKIVLDLLHQLDDGKMQLPDVMLKIEVSQGCAVLSLCGMNKYSDFVSPVVVENDRSWYSGPFVVARI